MAGSDGPLFKFGIRVVDPFGRGCAPPSGIHHANEGDGDLHTRRYTNGLSTPRSLGSLRSRVEWGCAEHSKLPVIFHAAQLQAPS